MLLLEGGCCIAEMLGCGPQAVLLAPRLTRAALSRDRRPVVALTEAIAFYQREISPRRPASCRFTPTCSQFAKEALDRHGLRRGGALAVRRLFRCRPGAAGGADPVPSS
jgi:putative membrane protein insertion efficiency factor